jgi:oligopeptide/dipeptide ABC transporter ATP-binding protein
MDPPAAEDGAPRPLLRVRNLTTVFPLEGATIFAVRAVSFDVYRGQVLGIVGESGSGKSVTGLSIMQLLDAPGRVVEGELLFDGMDLARLDDRAVARVRGRRIGMIFQNPGATLNPVLSVGYQLKETLRTHRRIAEAGTRSASLDLLRLVGIGDPERVLDAYPFQLSGGMQQRVMIGLAIAGEPDLLIADEPTTALDVTSQAQLLDHLDDLRRRFAMSVIFITHDIALLADFADVIVVMYAGRVCESGPRERVIDNPQHPYTRALLNAVARADVSAGSRLAAIPGDPPDAARPPAGCPFAPRCPSAMPVCSQVNPAPTTVSPGHTAACHLLTGEAAAAALVEAAR